MADVVEDLNVVAKEVFSKKPLPDLIPNGTKIQKAITFSQGEQLGKKFVETVRLAYPSGFTHAKGDGTAGAFSLKDSKGGTQARAELSASQIVLRDQMAYEDAAKCTGEEQAFARGTKYFFEGMQKAMRKRLETQMWHGSMGLGAISGAPATDGSNKVLTLLTSKFAAGHWVGMEGTKLDAYNGASQINTNAPLVIEECDIEARTITVSGNGTDLGNLADTHTLYFEGAYGNEMYGVHKLMTTDSKYGIDGGVYSLWKSGAYAMPASGPFSFKALKRAISTGVNKGLDEDVDFYLNPKAWDDVLDDIVAMRRTDKEEVGKVTIGAKEIEFNMQNGVVRLIPTFYCWEGYGYGLCGTGEAGYWKRIGAYDVSFKAPGFGDDIFMHLQSKAGVEARSYTHQTIMCDAPAKQLYVSGIVCSTD